MDINHPSDRFIRMQSKLGGYCRQCKQGIAQGDTIIYDRVKHLAVHFTCPALIQSIKIIEQREK